MRKKSAVARIKDLLRPVKRAMRVALGRDLWITLDRKMALEWHGSEYGGWPIISQSLQKDSVVLSAGLGADVTFDESLIAKYGCTIHGYDPSSRAIGAFADGALSQSLIWNRVGIGGASGTLKLYQPKRDDFVSGTLLEGSPDHSTSFELVEIVDIVAAIREASNEKRVAILKMDIEGAEYAVVDRLVESREIDRIDYLLIEFHHGSPNIPVAWTRKAVAQVREAGFQVVFVASTGREVGFLRAPSAQ